LSTAFAEPALKNARINDRFQFLRKGYFTLDNKDTYHRLVFNRTVTLKDAWAREMKK
jgi:glutaminyl-tRNA synthetase